MKAINKHRLLATIASQVTNHNDNYRVFAVTQEVIGQFRKGQGEELAKLVYQGSRLEKGRIKHLAEGFEALAKRRDSVLEVINTARTLYGFGRYTLPELAVYSFRMNTGIEGAPVWQGINSCAELMECLRHDQAQFELLKAWGRSQSHADEALEAEAAITQPMVEAWEYSLLAIGRAMRRKGAEVVPFLNGHAAPWAVDAYHSTLSRAGKPGAILRGVSDAIKAAINAAYFADRNAKSVDNGYTLAGVVQGHRTAYSVLFPREGDGRRAEVRWDANAGQEDYAGAESVLVDVGTQVVDLGNNPTAEELREAINAYLASQSIKARRLLDDAEACMARLTAEIKHGDAWYGSFAALMGAIWGDLAASARQRKEAAEASEALQLAKLAVQVASKMDAASRSMFIKAQGHLPLGEAAALIKAEADAAASRALKAAEAQREAAKAEAEAAEKEAAYAATAMREAERKEAAERQATNRRLVAEREAAARRRVEAEFAAARAKERAEREAAEPTIVEVKREIPSVAEYRAMLTKSVGGAA